MRKRQRVAARLAAVPLAWRSWRERASHPLARLAWQSWHERDACQPGRAGFGAPRAVAQLAARTGGEGAGAEGGAEGGKGASKEGGAEGGKGASDKNSEAKSDS